MKIVTAAQMREVEQKAVRAGVSLDTLMENAGKAVADALIRDYGPITGKKVMILVGPGNNGGDGLVAARHLAAAGAQVTAFITGRRLDPDTKLDLALAAGIATLRPADEPSHHDSRALAAESDLILDAILGAGQRRHISPPLSGQIEHIRRGAESGRTPIVALDIPTGVNSDTGAADPNGLPADRILTLGLPKLGLYLRPTVEPLHDVEILDIGIPRGVRAPSDVELIDDALAASLLPDRPIASNKGTFGRVLVIAGSKNYVGAARLACESAARSGAGLVTLATPEPVYRLVAATLSDATYLPLPADEAGYLAQTAFSDELAAAIDAANALLIGPGLGRCPSTHALVDEITSSGLSKPAILDADCINILAATPHWWDGIPRSTAVITPHPGEMSRLTGKPVAAIQADRLWSALDGAAEWGVTVVLKGACTVITRPDGAARIAPFANSGLATAGTGDVLSGLIAGLLAQGIDPFDAAALGVYIHGQAGEMARNWHGEAGMLASDLIAEIPGAIAGLSG